LKATSVSGAAKGRQDQRADAAGEERTQTGGGQRGTGTALARHLVAVDHGHDRRGFTGQVHQNGGGGAAVLGAVVDAGQHDQRSHRRQRISGGQQHGDRGHRAHAREHADQGAQQTADEGVNQVLEGEGDAKTQSKVVEKFHVVFLLNLR